MTGGYGSVDILHSCTVGVERGEIAVVVGPNGAGKSTAMKAIFGMLALRGGQVIMKGEDITTLKPQERVLKGMGFVPQTQNVFPSMTVEENLEMGAFIRRDDVAETMGQVFDLFPILKDKRHQPAGELSGGQRQQVAVEGCEDAIEVAVEGAVDGAVECKQVAAAPRAPQLGGQAGSARGARCAQDRARKRGASPTVWLGVFTWHAHVHVCGTA